MLYPILTVLAIIESRTIFRSAEHFIEWVYREINVNANEKIDQSILSLETKYLLFNFSCLVVFVQIEDYNDYLCFVISCEKINGFETF